MCLEKRGHHRRSPSPIPTFYPCQSLTKARNASSLQGGANQPNDRRFTNATRGPCLPALAAARRFRTGRSCKSPSVQGKKRCRMHGGGAGVRRSARQQERAKARPLYAQIHRGTPATAGADAAIAHANSRHRVIDLGPPCRCPWGGGGCAVLSSLSSLADCASFLAGLRSIASHPFFGSLRLAKAHPFPAPVILDEINPSGFECAADSRLNGQGNRYLPVYNLGSSDGCHGDF